MVRNIGWYYTHGQHMRRLSELVDRFLYKVGKVICYFGGHLWLKLKCYVDKNGKVYNNAKMCMDCGELCLIG
jgi:hypothetical protein